VVAAALANGIVPAHNVCLSLKDGNIIHADARRARDEFGFQRMWSIHPDQIAFIVEAMQPDFEEVADACAILQIAQDADWGPIQFKGELHDRATYRYFWNVLEKAHATGVELPAEVVQRFFG
jgi:citrate lyase subunit beta/citryl-CoA lyase